MPETAPTDSAKNDPGILGDILRDTGGFFRYLLGKLREDRCQQSAAALTYVTLFALVPMITVFYTILSAFPMFEAAGSQIQELIFSNFVPSTGEEISDYLVSFSEKARSLTAAGTIMLVVSAYLMLKNIEKSFNQIWRVKQARSGMANFLLYWAVLSLGPLLLGAGILISTYLFSLDVFSDSGEAGHLMLRILPVFLNFGTFTLIYAAVPNCRVPIRHAALGGVVTTLLFGIVKSVFGWSAGLGSYQLIYGAFAALPLFLMWIYLSWLMLLLGAEFVHSLSSWRGTKAQQMPDLMIALAVLEQTWRRLQTGQTLSDAELLSANWMFGRETLSPARWQDIRERLLAHNFLRLTEQGDLLTGTDPAAISLWDLQTALSPLQSLQLPEHADYPDWFTATAAELAIAEHTLRSQLHRPLSEIFNHSSADSQTTEMPRHD